MIRHLILPAILAALAASSVAHATETKPSGSVTGPYLKAPIVKTTDPFVHNSELPVTTGTAIHPGTGINPSRQPGLNCTVCGGFGSTFGGGVGPHPG